MKSARRSRGVRLATVLAACLTTFTAFGLHPEPAGAAAAAIGPERVQVPAARVVDAGPHECLACRAHRPLLSVSSLAAAPAPHRSNGRVSVLRPSVLAEFEPSRPDGRAPPDPS